MTSPSSRTYCFEVITLTSTASWSCRDGKQVSRTSPDRAARSYPCSVPMPDIHWTSGCSVRVWRHDGIALQIQLCKLSIFGTYRNDDEQLRQNYVHAFTRNSSVTWMTSILHILGLFLGYKM